MAIGSYYKHLSRSKLGFFITGMLGISDLHAHIRLRPVIKFLKQYMGNDKYYNILEIGCGNGINAFEISKVKDKFNYLGFDLNSNAVESAKDLAKKLKLDSKIRLIHADATKYKFADARDKFDIVLLIDFLEHVENPLNTLNELMLMLKNGAIFVVSVPTRNYPRVFGRAYHEHVGHIRDGFTLQELQDLFRYIACDLVFAKYNTGPLSNIGCAFYYRMTTSNKYLNFFKRIITYPFLFVDIANGERWSSSLFAVFKISTGEKIEN